MFKTKSRFKECISCTGEMNGIYCYSIRKECSLCGGMSLTIPKEEKKQLERAKAA